MANITPRKNKDGSTSYLIRVYVDETNTGHQIVKSKTWRPAVGMSPSAIKKELNRQSITFEEKVKQGVISFEKPIKFSDYANIWLESSPLAFKTKERYIELLSRINEAIGYIRIDKLQAHHLESFYKNLSETDISMRGSYAISNNLNSIMKDRDLSRMSLSNLSGVAASTISAAARGKHISPLKAKAICKSLSLPTEKVFSIYNCNKGLSDKTILHHHRLICAILEKAKRERIVPFNVAAEHTTAPKVKHKEARFLDDKQAHEFLSLLIEETDIRIRCALILLLFTGIRRGELCGLSWSDIDYENQIISISRESQYQSGNGIVEKATKNEFSIRSIKVPLFVIETLLQYRAWWNSQRIMFGTDWKGEKERLFIQKDGRPINPDTINYWLKKFIKKNDFEYITPHSLRHTFATLQIAAGVDIRTLQARTGHAQASTLLNVYSHAIRSAQEAASDALESLLLKPTLIDNRTK